MLPILTYLDARPLIADGDCLSFISKGMSSKAIHLAQRIAGLEYAAVSHTAMAKWLYDRRDGQASRWILLAVEMDGHKNTLTPVSQYIEQGARFLVSSPPPKICMAGFYAKLKKALVNYIAYDRLDICKAALRLLSYRFVDNKRWFADNGKRQICSYFVPTIYAALGGDMPALPALPTPAEVASALKPKFWVEAQQ